MVNGRYCNIPSISNASFGHERSGSPSPNGLLVLKKLETNEKNTRDILFYEMWGKGTPAYINGLLGEEGLTLTKSRLVQI